MPHYEFICKACQKEFSKFMTLSEYEKGGVVCPNCGSDQVEQQMSVFYAVTGKKS